MSDYPGFGYAVIESKWEPFETPPWSWPPNVDTVHRLSGWPDVVELIDAGQVPCGRYECLLELTKGRPDLKRLFIAGEHPKWCVCGGSRRVEVVEVRFRDHTDAVSWASAWATARTIHVRGSR